MKKVTITLAIAATFLIGCNSINQATNEQRYYISWVAFCANRGYVINDSTSEAVNEYLDTWCGSVDEEQAFINAGVEL